MTAIGARLVAISSSTAEDLATVMRETPYPFPLLADPALEAIDAWGLRMQDEDHGAISRPAAFVLDAAGVVQFAHVGDHPRDRPEVAALLLALRSLIR